MSRNSFVESRSTRRLNGVRPRRPEQSAPRQNDQLPPMYVSMESGLEGRNNCTAGRASPSNAGLVSMESGLEGRNNNVTQRQSSISSSRLNGVRPRRPEQCTQQDPPVVSGDFVSMESGLEGRNNPRLCAREAATGQRLNGVRPRRPEQFLARFVPEVEIKSQWSPA